MSAFNAVAAVCANFLVLPEQEKYTTKVLLVLDAVCLLSLEAVVEFEAFLSALAPVVPPQAVKVVIIKTDSKSVHNLRIKSLLYFTYPHKLLLPCETPPKPLASPHKTQAE